MIHVATIELNGHPTWAHLGKGKKKPPIVLLHGGMSSSASLLRTLGPRLEQHFRVTAFDRRGHGRTRDTLAPFHYEDMADEVAAFLEYLGEPAHVVGHSDGGVVALLLARRQPALLRRVVAAGANFHFAGLRPMEEFSLDGPDFVRWAQDYGARSPDGVEHARAVVEKALHLFASEPALQPADLAVIDAPVLVLAGDDDVAHLTHTVALYEAIPQAQLAIVPATSHLFFKERPGASARIVRRFLRGQGPPVTLMPLRRAGPPVAT